jgi:hypothetical protein
MAEIRDKKCELVYQTKERADRTYVSRHQKKVRTAKEWTLRICF